MLKKLVLMVVMAGSLVAGGTAFVATTTDEGSQLYSNLILKGGRVTSIQGNVITVEDNKGIKRRFELNSVAGLKIGTLALCEEDCGRALRLGGEIIEVKRVLDDSPAAAAIIIIGGKVANIRGNVITVEDSKGIKRRFELNSVAGLKIGMLAICEEDRGRALRLGGEIIKVKRVLDDSPGR